MALMTSIRLGKRNCGSQWPSFNNPSIYFDFETVKREHHEIASDSNSEETGHNIYTSGVETSTHN